MNETAVAIAVVAVVVAVVAIMQVVGLRRRIDGVPADGDTLGFVRSVAATSTANAETLHRLDERLRELEGRMPYAMSYVGVVAYDAFGNITGQQSRSIALLNQRGDGLVITLLVARGETIFYTKQIAAGRGTEGLSPEETTAVSRALGR
ncbi:MAG: DUF4446 family protein [Acidimicrobiia bacterium]|nr:DUF4446 family protein [Acidimicrobiia bacterium]